MSVLVCLGCGELYQEGTINFGNENRDEFDNIMCPRYNCRSSVIELDEWIAETIIILNNKGYHTAYCCSGHLYDEVCETYIKFESEECIPTYIPEGFELESGNTIRLKVDCFHELDNVTRYEKLVEANLNLIKWANELEYNY